MWSHEDKKVIKEFFALDMVLNNSTDLYAIELLTPEIQSLVILAQMVLEQVPRRLPSNKKKKKKKKQIIK